MQLNPQQIRTLKQQAHHLRPVVTAGQKGLSQAVFDEIEIALEAHELIKVKLAGSERAERNGMGETIARRLHAQLVQLIGQVAILYRPNPKKKGRRIIV